MSAKITTIIAPDNFELIRDQLGAVLLLEIAKQVDLDSTLLLPTFWRERFVEFIAKEFPAINVRYQKGDGIEGSRERNQTAFNHCFYIDVSVIAKTSVDGKGDELATILLHRYLRIIRSILSNPIYNTLGFPKPFSASSVVNGIEVFEPMEFQDSTNQINGRIEYSIKVNEYVAIPVGVYTVNEVTDVVTLYGSERGYYWDFRQKKITIATTGATLTDSFFSNTILEINNYTAGVDFTQTGTTITATTFTFTAGQIITAIT